jgi:hypothetical protein
VTDATGRCARAFQQRLTRWLITGFREDGSRGDFNSLMGLISARVLFLTHYLLVSAAEARTRRIAMKGRPSARPTKPTRRSRSTSRRTAR